MRFGIPLMDRRVVKIIMYYLICILSGHWIVEVDSVQRCCSCCFAGKPERHMPETHRGNLVAARLAVHAGAIPQHFKFWNILRSVLSRFYI